MARLPRTLTGFLTILAAFICLLMSSDIGAAEPAAKIGATRQSILIDQQTLVMSTEPGVMPPAIDQDRAIAVATSHLAASTSQPKVSQARYVTLTLWDSSGQVVRGIRDRPTWLVDYQGVAYVPSSTASSVCACNVLNQRANTLVAVDANTGELMTVLGSDD
jgi:hypothetical protein